jgi:hypothetical protein
VAWLKRIFLILGGTVASWLMAEDAPNYSVIQGIRDALTFIVAVLAFSPMRWSVFLIASSPPDPGSLDLAGT